MKHLYCYTVVSWAFSTDRILQYARILQGDMLSPSVTMKLNLRVKGWWLIIQMLLWLFYFISGHTNYCWIWICSRGESETLTQAKTAPRTRGSEGLPDSHTVSKENEELLCDNSGYCDMTIMFCRTRIIWPCHNTRRHHPRHPSRGNVDHANQHRISISFSYKQTLIQSQVSYLTTDNNVYIS